MALAAYEVMKARDRMNIKIGGCDAMPPVLRAVLRPLRAPSAYG